MVPGIEGGTADLVQPVRAAILLGIGFAFLLAVFPFHTWVPMLAEQIQPYLVGFLFLLLPIAVLVFGGNFLNNYAWLRDLPHIYEGVRLGGILMVVGGGVLAAFQRHLGRVMGFSGLVSTGFALLATSLNSTTGQQIYNAQFLPWAIGLWVWAFGLSILLRNTNSLDHAAVVGQIREMPITIIAIFLAQFTLAGLPFLGYFPLRQALFSDLGKESFQMAAWAFLGNVGLLAAGLRGLVVVVGRGKDPVWAVKETPGEIILLGLGILGLLAIGWFPQVFLPLMLKLTGGG
jgi:NADH-quinone oxidoreductase subunit N